MTSNPPRLEMRQKISPDMKMTQRLIMMPQMQQAIQMLQMPILELTELLEMEIQENPLLETVEDAEVEQYEDSKSPLDDKDESDDEELSIDENDFEIMRRLDEDFRDHFDQNDQSAYKPTREDDQNKAFLDSLIKDRPSLYALLCKQAHECFDSEEDLKIAEILIGHLDNNGFLTTNLTEISKIHHFSLYQLKKVLEVIQTFRPYGVGAKNLQESLLIQMKLQGKEQTLAYKIVEECYDDLLHKRIPKIAKTLNQTTSEITQSIEQSITHLDLHPGNDITTEYVQHVTPDVIIDLEDDKLKVRVFDSPIPQFRINYKYVRMLNNPDLEEGAKSYIQQKLATTKWLLRTIDQRNDTLFRIAELLIKKQENYLKYSDGKLKPLKMKSLAEELELHESTIARAVANKYAQTPRGVIALRKFFCNALSTKEGKEVSSSSVRDQVEKLISEEDKRAPLSDQKISDILKEKGVSCARRTVAKYRQELHLGNAQQRRSYH